MSINGEGSSSSDETKLAHSCSLNLMLLIFQLDCMPKNPLLMLRDIVA